MNIWSLLPAVYYVVLLEVSFWNLNLLNFLILCPYLLKDTSKFSMSCIIWVFEPISVVFVTKSFCTVFKAAGYLCDHDNA